MKKVVLKIDKSCTSKACPIPIELLPKAEKGIKKVSYNKRTEIAEISFDSKILSEKELIEKLARIGYKVKGIV